MHYRKILKYDFASAGNKKSLIKFRLVGFNCRRYDNHILYARLMGYTNEQLYNLSRKIINGSANCFFGEAYNNRLYRGYKHSYPANTFQEEQRT